MIQTLLLALLTLVFALPVAWAGSDACGDSGMACGEEEKCCEHVVAYYSANGVNGTSYVEGQCVPKTQKCGQFWCGPKRCEGGFWGSPTVCCVEPRSGGAPGYQCAKTEMSCPGNTQSLTIRDNQPERRLQGI